MTSPVILNQSNMGIMRCDTDDLGIQVEIHRRQLFNDRIHVIFPETS